MKSALFRALLWLSSRFSPRANQRFAEQLARWVWRLSRRHRQVIETNIRLCFPHLSAQQQERLARQSLAETLKTALELGPVWKKYGHRIDDLVVNVSGWEAVQAAAGQGQGVLIAAPHLGNWEVLGMFLSRLPDFALLYKAPDQAGVGKTLLRYRGQAGARQIAATPTAVRQILKTLKGGGAVGILPDQKPKAGQGEFAPFFGQPAYTMTLFSRLAAKTCVPVFVAAAIRRPQGKDGEADGGFDLHFVPADEAIYGPQAESLASLNAALESLVLKAPEQYQWSYKRFSITPEGVPNPYRHPKASGD